MCARMRAQQMGVINVVGIAFAARDVVLGYVEHIEIILDADDGTQIFKTLLEGKNTLNLVPRLCLICSLMMQMG